MRHGAFERMVIEDVHREEQRELWLGPHRLFRLLTDASKQWIGASNADNPSGHTLRHDETPKLDRLGSSLAQPRPAAKGAAGPPRRRAVRGLEADYRLSSILAVGRLSGNARTRVVVLRCRGPGVARAAGTRGDDHGRRTRGRSPDNSTCDAADRRANRAADHGACDGSASGAGERAVAVSDSQGWKRHKR